jgi:nucleotidyltransferase/DNA polymerase involved in DNA repair
MVSGPAKADVAPGSLDPGVSESRASAFALCATADKPNPAPRASDQGDYSELYAALHDGDGAATERLMAIARDFSPRIECHRGGTIVLDVSGLRRLFGDPQSIAHHLAHAGASRVAIAVSQTTAILLARAHRGVTVAAGDPEAALRDVPLSILQQFVEENETQSSGSGPRTADNGLPTTDHGKRPAPRVAVRRSKTFEVLERWGLTTIGEFSALPAGELSARLGPLGMAHQRLARGFDRRPLVPDPGVRRFIESFELEWPIEMLEPLSFVFARLLEPLAAALEKADRGGIALHVRLRLTDRTTHVRTLGLPAPMRDPRVLRTLLLLDLESHPPAAAVDVVTIEIDPAPGRIVQFSLLERPVPSPETLATLMARLGALVGETRCGSPQLVDTHRPDGWVMTPVNLADRGRVILPPDQPPPRLRRSAEALCAKAEGGSHAPFDSAAPRSGQDHSGPADQASGPADRPAMTERHLRPSAFAKATADGSGSGGQARELAVRRFRPPVAIRVVVEGGRPVRVAIDRRGMPGGEVRQSAGPWRTSGGWWTSERWNRDEWDVAFDDGAVCRIFQEREGGGWFVEGLYD